MGNEWSLTLFTLFAQASIGLAAINQFFNNKKRFNADKILLIALGLIAIALGISSLHLGSPLGAYRAIFNIGSSWLSREIFFSGAYLALIALCWLMEKRATGTGLKSITGWAAVAVGLLALISMASVYANSAVEAWDNFYTHLSFYATAVALGSFLFAALAYTKQEPEKSGITASLVIGSVAVGIQVIGFAVYALILMNGQAAAVESLRFLADKMSLVIFSQTLFLLSIAAAVYSFKNCQKGMANAVFLNGALITLFAAALVGRYLFYACGVLLLGKL